MQDDCFSINNFLPAMPFEVVVCCRPEAELERRSHIGLAVRGQHVESANAHTAHCRKSENPSREKISALTATSFCVPPCGKKLPIDLTMAQFQSNLTFC